MFVLFFHCKLAGNQSVVVDKHLYCVRAFGESGGHVVVKGERCFLLVVFDCFLLCVSHVATLKRERSAAAQHVTFRGDYSHKECFFAHGRGVVLWYCKCHNELFRFIDFFLVFTFFVESGKMQPGEV